jgi:hypothetical protein
MTVSPGYSVDPETGEEHADYGLATVDNRSYREAVNQQHYRDQQEDYSPYEDGIYDTGIHEDLDSQALTNAEQLQSWEKFHPVTHGNPEQMVRYWLNNQPMGVQERNHLIGAYIGAHERGEMDGEEVDRMCQLIMWKAGEISWDELCEVNPQAVSELMELSGGVAEDFMPDEWYDDASDNDAEEYDEDNTEVAEFNNAVRAEFAEAFGENAYMELVTWAKYNLSPTEIDAYDSVMESMDYDSVVQAIEGLVAKYRNYHNY